MKTGSLNSGDLARMAGVNKETLRFYERKGLLRKPERTMGGYRLYHGGDLDRIVFIKNAQELGFSLREIQELLLIGDGKITSRSEVRKIAVGKVDTINSQLTSLKKLKVVLTELISECDCADDISDCPIIESLSKGKDHD